MAVAAVEVARAAHNQRKSRRSNIQTVQSGITHVNEHQGFWGVVLLAIVILTLLEVSGKKPGWGTYAALLAYAVIGGIYPPLGIGVGTIIVLRILYTNPNIWGQSLTNATKGMPSTIQSKPGSPATGGNV